MMNLLASALTGFGMLFGGLLGHFGPMHGDMGSTSPEHMGTSTLSNYHRPAPGIVGKVVSISGTTIMVNGRVQEGEMASTTYSVDASAAKFISFHLHGTASSTPITISDVKDGDLVLVMGTVSGTAVTAKTVVDGLPPHFKIGPPMMRDGHMMQDGHMMTGGDQEHPGMMGSSTSNRNTISE